MSQLLLLIIIQEALAYAITGFKYTVDENYNVIIGMWPLLFIFIVPLLNVYFILSALYIDKYGGIVFCLATGFYAHLENPTHYLNGMCYSLVQSLIFYYTFKIGYAKSIIPMAIISRIIFYYNL